MVSTCLILEMKNKKDITYKKQKVMKKKRNKKKSMKEYVKEFLEHYKVVKVTDGKYQLRPKSGGWSRNCPKGFIGNEAKKILKYREEQFPMFFV